MSHLLDLFDSLIAESLSENVYSNERNYYTTVVSPNNSKLENRETPETGDINQNIYNDRSQGLKEVGASLLTGGGSAIVDSFSNDSKSPFVPKGVPSVLGSTFATAHWLRNISKEFGIISDPNIDRTKAVTKFTLYALGQNFLAQHNPGDLELGGQLNRTFNPLSFAISAVPGTRTATTLASPNLAVASSLAIGDYRSRTIEASKIENGERLIRMRQGSYLKTPGLSDISNFNLPEQGFLGDIAAGTHINRDTLQSPGDPASSNVIEGQVDGGELTNIAKKQGLHTNTYDAETPYNPQNAAMPIEKVENTYTKARRAAVPQINPEKVPDPSRVKHDKLYQTAQTPVGESSISKLSSGDLAQSDNARGVENKAAVPAIMPDMVVHDNEDLGTGTVTGLEKKDEFEDSIYMPFMFQDLRDTPPEFLYFNAFLSTDISDTYTPDWNTERYYGRVDQVPVYMGTIRSIAFSFDIVAFKPQDLSLMYVKIHKLRSMCYPEFDTFGFLKKGPLVRVRVGDLFASQGKLGLPGYFTSLDMAFDDGIWNLKNGFNVPRKVRVSVAFNVVHDGNPGIYPFSEQEIAPDGSIVEEQNSRRTFGAMKTNAKDNITSMKVVESNIQGVLKASRDELKKI